ncbi:kinase-like protein [Neocallimastix lanati (nom. inval.)]|jgi:serine/threonine protein kinase|uniref:Kinase-like protein n=1 Tax=Neocallimastix californiae TaxID=1754190 RepID=A0A1Y2AJB6_9FUNG|nr:kinase-like protein [Neocallimastix sp. JGI-2020a]ORY22297.1 kinase-like protein [Neocallimastix californiae]|eukprot:ORY22297.1 kinase-like protein [Neocallimastix californiae]
MDYINSMILSKFVITNRIGLPPKDELNAFHYLSESKQSKLWKHTKPTKNKWIVKEDSSSGFFKKGAKKKSIDEYEIIKVLGVGAHGDVKLAHKKNDSKKKQYAIKTINKDKIIPELLIGNENRKIPLEIHILDFLSRHLDPAGIIVEMTDYFEDDINFYVVMKYFDSGIGMDLFDFIDKQTEWIEESRIKKIFKQLCLGISHLHSLGIVHRDIKDENVILDETCTKIQLVDFGSSGYYRPGLLNDIFFGTEGYAAPEIVFGEKYSGPEQDIWSLGVLLYTLIYQENPYLQEDFYSKPLQIPFILSEDSLDLLRWMLNKDPSCRPTIKEILNHPWLKD